jgi:hypothetical protein
LVAAAAALPVAWHLQTSSSGNHPNLQNERIQPPSAATASAEVGSNPEFSAWEKDPSCSNTTALAGRILSHGKLIHSALLERIASAYEKDPQRYAEAMHDFATAVFDSDPGGSLDFLARLHNSPGIVPLERELMNRWVGEDASHVTDSLVQSSRHSFASPIIQLAFLASVCQKEQPDKLPQLTAWVAGLNDPKDADLKISAVEALVETSDAHGFPAVAGILTDQLDQPAMAAWAARLAARQISDSPTEILDWIKAVPPGEGKRSMLEDVIGALSASHPEIAAELINEPARLAEIFGTPGDPNLDQMQDTALARYLDATMREAPDNALQVSGMFHDSGLASTYGEKARRLLAASRH